MKSSVAAIFVISAIVLCTGADEQPDDTAQGQRVDIVLSGRDIPSFDFWSESDPYVKVYYQFDSGSSYIFYGQTTASQDNPNPDWPQSFSFDFSGGDGNTQRIKLECWDEDVIWDDHIGDVEISLADLVTEAAASNDGRVQRVLQTINEGIIIMKTRLGTPSAEAGQVDAPAAPELSVAPGLKLNFPIAQFLNDKLIQGKK